jgi:UDP-3-O-acyl-N-acetylglucosamine deacetylase
VLPAPSNAGIVFREAVSGQEIAGVCENVHNTVRCTAISAGGHEYQTVEHLLSALAGTGVTDAVIEFEGPEVPAVDGSSAPFVTVIREAGLVDLGDAISPITVAEPLVVTDGGGGSITVVPSDRLWATVVLDYPQKPGMLPVAASYYGIGYDTLIAPARTYGFVSELRWLAENGLAKGASKENAFALNDDGTPDPETPLRFPNEPARHKLLDLLGDLALAGRPIRAGMIALRPSHTLNAVLASKLRQLGR